MTPNPVFALWLTGLPASGKSTLANLLAHELHSRKIPYEVLDSDQVRILLTPQPTYDHGEREWFYWVLANLGELLTRNGINVIFAGTAHRRSYRQKARTLFVHFIEVYVKCPLELCMERDLKGIYQKAIAGEAEHVPGIQELYQAPKKPQIIVDTETQNPSECMEKIIQYLEVNGYLS